MSATETKTIRDLCVPGEWELRVQLAACYRIFSHMGWAELIYNHISVKVPGPDHHFLINPYGLHYDEVTASNLVKIDLEGKLVDESPFPINPAGFIIHSAIHEAREDAICIAHTHTTAGMTVACQKDGLRWENFYSCLLHGQIAYHDFEGITVNPGEKDRLVSSLGGKSMFILRNHGLLTTGNSIPAAFENMWVLERSCQIQVSCDASGRELIPVSPEMAVRSGKMSGQMVMSGNYGELEFAAMVRRVDRIDPSYKL